MKKVTVLAAIGTVLLVIAGACFLSGCTETQKWATGDPPVDYIANFGNDNIARLAFVQGQRIDEHRILIRGLDGKDDAGNPTHQPGIVDYLADFDRRLRLLEDQNTVALDEIEQRVATLETMNLGPDDPIEGHLRWIRSKPALRGREKGHLEFYDGKEWKAVE